jgi:hypothetical protein
LCQEDDVGTGDSVEQAANSGGQQKMGSIIILSEEQRKKKALLELKNLFYGKFNKCSQWTPTLLVFLHDRGWTKSWSGDSKLREAGLSALSRSDPWWQQRYHWIWWCWWTWQAHFVGLKNCIQRSYYDETEQANKNLRALNKSIKDLVAKIEGDQMAKTAEAVQEHTQNPEIEAINDASWLKLFGVAYEPV